MKIVALNCPECGSLIDFPAADMGMCAQHCDRCSALVRPAEHLTRQHPTTHTRVPLADLIQRFISLMQHPGDTCPDYTAIAEEIAARIEAEKQSPVPGCLVAGFWANAEPFMRPGDKLFLAAPEKTQVNALGYYWNKLLLPEAIEAVRTILPKVSPSQRAILSQTVRRDVWLAREARDLRELLGLDLRVLLLEGASEQGWLAVETMEALLASGEQAISHLVANCWKCARIHIHYGQSLFRKLPANLRIEVLDEYLRTLTPAIALQIVRDELQDLGQIHHAKLMQIVPRHVLLLPEARDLRNLLPDDQVADLRAESLREDLQDLSAEDAFRVAMAEMKQWNSAYLEKLMRFMRQDVLLLPQAGELRKHLHIDKQINLASLRAEAVKVRLRTLKPDEALHAARNELKEWGQTHLEKMLPVMLGNVLLLPQARDLRERLPLDKQAELSGLRADKLGQDLRSLPPEEALACARAEITDWGHMSIAKVMQIIPQEVLALPHARDLRELMSLRDRLELYVSSSSMVELEVELLEIIAQNKKMEDREPLRTFWATIQDKVHYGTKLYFLAPRLVQQATFQREFSALLTLTESCLADDNYEQRTSWEASGVYSRINDEDRKLAESWMPQNPKDRAFHMARMLSARCAEKVALAFYESLGHTVTDVSRTQLPKGVIALFRAFHEENACFPLDGVSTLQPSLPFFLETRCFPGKSEVC